MSDHKFNPFAKGSTVPPVPVVVLDRYGRPLDEGAEIVVQSPHPTPPFRVLKVVPALDPNLPPGAIYVDIICRWRFVAARNIPVQEFLLVRTPEEAGVLAHQSEEAAEEAAPKLVEEGLVDES